METYESKCKFNLGETCCASISVDDLRALSWEGILSPLSPSTKLTYGAIRGSDQLRENLSSLYSAKWESKLSIDNILITTGAIQANFLLHYTLLEPGDHVICHYPTYQQLYSVPESLGAQVSLWRAKEQDGWKLDIKELEALIKPNTKLIILKCASPPLSHCRILVANSFQ
jgi:aspartate/methionine/tyrosine aminotransferase